MDPYIMYMYTNIIRVILSEPHSSQVYECSVTFFACYFNGQLPILLFIQCQTNFKFLFAHAHPSDDIICLIYNYTCTLYVLHTVELTMFTK